MNDKDMDRTWNWDYDDDDRDCYKAPRIYEYNVFI